MSIDRDALLKRIKLDNPSASLEYVNQKIAELENVDKRLEKNVQEYIDESDISDIWIDEYCVNLILKIWGDQGDVLQAILDLDLYSKDKDAGSSMIHYRFAKK